ncbi:unnamed protein product, partial [Nesidiocoris tenuis]
AIATIGQCIVALALSMSLGAADVMMLLLGQTVSLQLRILCLATVNMDLRALNMYKEMTHGLEPSKDPIERAKDKILDECYRRAIKQLVEHHLIIQEYVGIYLVHGSRGEGGTRIAESTVWRSNVNAGVDMSGRRLLTLTSTLLTRTPVSDGARAGSAQVSSSNAYVQSNNRFCSSQFPKNDREGLARGGYTPAVIATIGQCIVAVAISMSLGTADVMMLLLGQTVSLQLRILCLATGNLDVRALNMYKEITHGLEPSKDPIERSKDKVLDECYRRAIKQLVEHHLIIQE